MRTLNLLKLMALLVCLAMVCLGVAVESRAIVFGWTPPIVLLFVWTVCGDDETDDERA